ncbi:MAG: sugar phosphate isomerase/epimerase [Kiritimatiellaeota bacterium]|nr:sugar phosphate isomerase/epimerase [Kiritimatiellota bacterium]
MRDDIREFARIGLVHHMLYPACMDDARLHTETLAEFATRDDIETFDCCLPFDREAEKRLAPIIRDAGKTDVTFATHLFPLRKLSFCSTSDSEQGLARLVVEEMIRQAAAIGATGFIFASGGPSPDLAAVDNEQAFAEFARWLCGRLAPHGITAQLEPFDTDVDKCFLYGSTSKCVQLIESLRPEVDNLGIELDVAHLPLMGESFESAIRTCAPHLKRVHLGNCVLRDTTHPRYGDTHPPVGFPGGEIDVPEIAEILALLLDIDFLDRTARGNLVIEMTPWPGKTVEETVADNFARLEEAWRRV